MNSQPDLPNDILFLIGIPCCIRPRHNESLLLLPQTCLPYNRPEQGHNRPDVSNRLRSNFGPLWHVYSDFDNRISFCVAQSSSRSKTWYCIAPAAMWNVCITLNSRMNPLSVLFSPFILSSNEILMHTLCQYWPSQEQIFCLIYLQPMRARCTLRQACTRWHRTRRYLVVTAKFIH